MRVLLALGGNAMTAADGSATPEAQQSAIAGAMESVAGLIAAGHEVVITHGNGPQVGNLLVKNELAAGVVPPVPLDWCGAQTQATIGFTIINTLERSLRRHGCEPRVTAIVTRALVDGNDPGFTEPTKPIGRFLPYDRAKTLIEHGQVWQDRGDKGWRRIVASPAPMEVLETPVVLTLIAAGYVVVAAGGGGIPVVRDPDGGVSGVEAVIDKDLTAALLARSVGADVLVIATDVDNAIIGFETPEARPIHSVTLDEMRDLASAGHFASGSMGPKVMAAIQFVERGGQRAVITSLEHIEAAITGEFGTVIEGRTDSSGNNASHIG
ncbi:MAG: carbamate kinase [Actinomycetota bacterium]